MTEHGMATLAVHAGAADPRPDYTPICAPIHNAVTYTYGDMSTLDAVFSGQCEGYVYSRFGSPTVATLERAVAQLAGTAAAVACGSGMAALHLALLAAGTRPANTVLAAEDLYGGTLGLLREVLAASGVRVQAVDMTDLNAVARAIEESQPTVVLVETISNPLLRLANVCRVAQLTHTAGAALIVDNTFATPCLYRPADDGADYVVHSATKYLGGHGDVVAGVIAASEERCQAARELQKLIGNVLGPNEAWLILRGLKTLVLRMRQHCHNANLVAHFLSSHPRVRRVYYPSLPTHPQFTLCRQLFATNMCGGVVSFELDADDQVQVFRFMDALQLIRTGTSLGDVTSLILYPAHSSHRSLSEAERQQLGIVAGLVRLSAGIEDACDIVADLAQALAALQ